VVVEEPAVFVHQEILEMAVPVVEARVKVAVAMRDVGTVHEAGVELNQQEVLHSVSIIQWQDPSAMVAQEKVGVMAAEAAEAATTVAAEQQLVRVVVARHM
jgi:hypothetical protein